MSHPSPFVNLDCKNLEVFFEQRTNENRADRETQKWALVAERIGINRKSIWLVCGGDAPCYLFGACFSIESDNHRVII